MEFANSSCHGLRSAICRLWLLRLSPRRAPSSMTPSAEFVVAHAPASCATGVWAGAAFHAQRFFDSGCPGSHHELSWISPRRMPSSNASLADSAMSPTEILCPTRTEHILGRRCVSCSAILLQWLYWISPLRMLSSKASQADSVMASMAISRPTATEMQSLGRCRGSSMRRLRQPRPRLRLRSSACVQLVVNPCTIKASRPMASRTVRQLLFIAAVWNLLTADAVLKGVRGNFTVVQNFYGSFRSQRLL